MQCSSKIISGLLQDDLLSVLGRTGGELWDINAPNVGRWLLGVLLQIGKDRDQHVVVRSGRVIHITMLPRVDDDLYAAAVFIFYRLVDGRLGEPWLLSVAGWL